MKMNRRRFTQTLAGGVVGATSLASLTMKDALACGDILQPKRVIFVIEGCGMNYTRFTPSDIPNQAAGEYLEVSNFSLSPMMNQLARHQDKLVLIDGLSNDQGLAGSGHSTAYAALSCVPNDPPNETGRPGGETIDMFLGRAMGHCVPFPNLLLAAGQTNAARLTAISATSDRRPVPHFCNPGDAFDQLFGTVASVENRSLARKRAVFELVRGDLERLGARLTGRQREKLDAITRSIDAIDARDAALTARADELQACVAELTRPTFDGPEEQLDAHFKVASAALACDLTRVVTIASGCGFNFLDMSFPGLGLSGTKHAMGHGYAGGLDALDMIHNFHAGLIADLCDRLQAIPEGDGSMLDHTLIVWTNENGEQHHAGYQRWPVVLLAGDRIGIQRGRYIRYPAKGFAGARTLADFWNTLCHLAGAPRNDFGAQGREMVTGPLESLLA